MEKKNRLLFLMKLCSKLSTIVFVLIVACFFEFCNGGQTKNDQKSKDTIGMNHINGIVKEYYPNGTLSSQKMYLNDTLNGPTYEYDENGALEASCFFWKGNPVGSITYYHKNKVILYNERDLKREIYYVIKYDTLGNIIKEQGVAISPSVDGDISADTISPGRHFKLYFSYAEPPGYENHFQAKVNDEVITLKRLEGHLLLLDTSFTKEGGYHIVVTSELFRNGDLFLTDHVEKSLSVTR